SAHRLRPRHAVAGGVGQVGQRQARRVAGELVHAAHGAIERGGGGHVAGGEQVGERVVVAQRAVAAAVEAVEHGLADAAGFQVLDDGADVLQPVAGGHEQDGVGGADEVGQVRTLAPVPVAAAGGGVGRG